MKPQIAVLCNPDKPEAKKALKSVLNWLHKNHVSPITRLVDSQLASCEFAVVLGGDGTILRFARKLAPLQVPILGVNLGRLGFLAETDFKNLFITLKRALQSELVIDERLMLEISAEKNKPKALALNDCYIHAGSSSRILEIETTLNGKYLANYVGDGLIISTPTGSTAYSLAASGPIVSPNLPVMLLTPICPHTLAQRPLLISNSDQIELKIKDLYRSEYAHLSIDGQETIKIGSADTIGVRASEHKLKLLVDTERDYYKILRTKLRWGER